MKLGLKNDEVRLDMYDPEWKQEFNRVKMTIARHTSLHEERIVHIGSTAIEGMPSKPIIDIMIGVDHLEKVDESLFNQLKELGFLRLRVKRAGEIVLAKFTDDSYEVKSHFIHLTEFRSTLWKDLLFFRNFLNSDEKARNEYYKLKVEYVQTTSTGIIEYTNHKERFVKEILRKRSQKE